MKSKPMLLRCAELQKGYAKGNVLETTIKNETGQEVSFLLNGVKTTIFTKRGESKEQAIERYKSKLS